jgi:hypothetical protein
MNHPAELGPGVLKVALSAIDSLLKFRAYTPGGLFVILLGKFGDDVRDVLSMVVEEKHERTSGRANTPADAKAS